MDEVTPKVSIKASGNEKPFCMLTIIQTRHGYPAMGLSRGQFLEILYEALPHSQETVRTGCRVVDLQITANGVTAVLQDGRTEEASIVIGSDGVWSKTKEALQQLNTELDTEMFSTRINFQGLYGKAPAMSGVKPGTFYETRSNGIATQVVGSEGTMLFSLIQTVDTSTPVPRKYTLEDREAMASRFAEVQVAPGVRFKDVWRIAERETATMVNQEEGYAANWHHGRLVIVGDAAHKMTSISGLGLNTGLHSAAVLVNQLHDIHRLNKDPPAFLIEDAFATYYNIRQSETYSAFRLGQSLTRNVTWSSWADWIWDRFIMPWLNQDYIICDRISPLVSRGQLLSYVPFQELKGVVPWQSQSKERY